MLKVEVRETFRIGQDTEMTWDRVNEVGGADLQSRETDRVA